MDPVPQSSPGAAVAERRAEYAAAIAAVLDSGRYILGDTVNRFEAAFARFVGVGDAVGVASGTDALEIALRATGLRPGEIVFTVSHTAVATVVAIIRAGGIPFLVDIDPRRYTMDPDDLEASIRKLPSGAVPRAVVPVHLYGAPADMASIGAIARMEGLVVVEDCAQAHGGEVDGHRLGSLGNAAAFSFYPTKNLGALGDGGAVVTDDPKVASAARAFREYGWQERFVSTSFGSNSRLDELQAAVLLVGLRHLSADNQRREAIAARYDDSLPRSLMALPLRPKDSRHVFHQYVVGTAARDAVRERLAKAGIGTSVHYPVPIHRQPAFRDVSTSPGGLSVTDRVASEILSLPMYPQLEVAQIDRVVAAFLAAS